MEIAIFLVILSIATIATSIRIVKQQTLAIVEVFGKYNSTLEPGLQFVLPFGMALIAKEMSLKIFEISSRVEIKTKDNQFVLMPTSIMYQVIPEMAAEAYYKLDDAPSQIQSWVLNSIKAKASDMNLEDLFTDRETLEKKAKEDLDAKFQDYGYQIISVLVSQPTLQFQ